MQKFVVHTRVDSLQKCIATWHPTMEYSCEEFFVDLSNYLCDRQRKGVRIGTVSGRQVWVHSIFEWTEEM